MTVPPQYQQLHQAALQALQDAVDHLPPAYAHMAQMLRDVHDHPERHWPHPVYLLELDAPDGLRQAQLVGWQYLAKADGNRSYAIEVQCGPDGADCQFAKMDHGPVVEGMCQALADPELHQQLTAGQLRLATLVVSELDTQALWLQADEPERELILAMPPAPPTLKPWPAVYTVKQFQAALRDEARREL